MTRVAQRNGIAEVCRVFGVGEETIETKYNWTETINKVELFAYKLILYLPAILSHEATSLAYDDFILFSYIVCFVCYASISMKLLCVSLRFV